MLSFCYILYHTTTDTRNSPLSLVFLVPDLGAPSLWVLFYPSYFWGWCLVFFFWCLGFDRSAESYKIGFLFLFWAVPLSLSSLLAAVSFFYVSVFFRFRFPAGHLAQAPGFWIRFHSSVIASSTRPSFAASSAPGLRPGHPPLALA